MLVTNGLTVATIALVGGAVPAWISYIARWVRRPCTKKTENALFTWSNSWIAFTTLSVALTSTGTLALVCLGIGILALVLAALSWEIRDHS